MIFRVLASQRRGGALFLTLIAALAGSFAPVHGAGALAEDLFPQLRDVLQAALTQSPRMVERNLQRLESEQLALVSSSPLYPHLTLSGRYDTATEDRASDDPSVGWEATKRYNAFLTVSQPLYHWGELKAGAEIGRIQTKLAANQVREAYRDLARSIRGSYLQLIIDQAALRQGRRSEERIRRQMAVIEARIASGELQPGSNGYLQILLNEATLGIARAEAAFERALRTFRRLCGNPDFAADQLPESIPDVPRLSRADVARASEGFIAGSGLGADGRFENLSFELKMQRLRLQIAKVAQRPKLDLQGGYSQDQLTYVSNLGRRTSVQSFYVGLSVSWNVFDGRATRGNVLAHRTRLQQMETRLEDLEEDLRYAAGQSGTEVDFAARALKNAEDRHGAANAGFSLTQQNFGRQRASQDDLDNAQFGLNDAEINLFRARADYLNALAAWFYSTNADPAVPDAIPTFSAP